MIRTFLVEFVFPLLVFLLLRSLLRGFFQGSRNVTRRDAAPPQPTVVAGGDLKKDPVCGTYVSTALSVTRKVNGEVVHFCSTECRDKYRG